MGLRAKAVENNGIRCDRSKLKHTAAIVLRPAAAATAAPTTTATCSSSSITATFRSSSTSALVKAPSYLTRPQTLNVNNGHETPAEKTKLYFGEALTAWLAKARSNNVPAECTQELFHQLSFNPSETQISDMLQTSKMLGRKSSRQILNGLTLGEFCLIAADLKRFRTSTFPTTTVCDNVHLLSSLENDADVVGKNTTETANCSLPLPLPATATELRSTKSMSNVDDCNKKATNGLDSSAQVEVFLGGSCNPTTWRADVAIPALKELGISFYNPQVSDWTPDLIELEHRAKEKARVLFFVMDSETRASAGAIEAAHIAGQNCKQLVLVLHPYRANQYILNEHISQQEYIDLTRNQLILKELVTRRGLPVMDNIPAGLQRTKEILAGIRDPPSNIASILVVTRGAFDRVSPVNNVISIEQCQRALLYLGYAQSLLNIDNLNKVVTSQRESLLSLQKKNLKAATNSATAAMPSTSSTTTTVPVQIDFELFCVVSAYLSVLQQEIHESGCISPIKGTNVPPPPVYLTNMQGDESFAISYYTSKNISRTSSNNSVPGSDERQTLNELLSRSRDSGTSSPQPLETPLKSRSSLMLGKQSKSLLVSIESAGGSTQSSHHAATLSATVLQNETSTTAAEEESDSNDSVFSSSSSINSINCSSEPLSTSFTSLDFRDVYLGGSCCLRTTWRQEIAMPYLKSKGVTFHLPALHESLQPSKLDLPDKACEERTYIRTRRKCKGAAAAASATNDSDAEQQQQTVEEVTSAETLSWTLPSVRPNLFNPSLLDSSRVLLFIITNETRSLAPMTLAAHCIGLMYNVVLAVQMLPEDCVISNEKLTPAAIKDYNRGRSYLIDLAKRQGVPVFSDLKPALECTLEKIKACNSRSRYNC